MECEIIQALYQEENMHTHGIFEAEKTPLEALDPLAWKVGREQDRKLDKKKLNLLSRRPRQRRPSGV